MISFFHFTDDKLIHTIWQLSYESCYPSASSTEDNVMLSIPRTSFQYCFCLFFSKADQNKLVCTICYCSQSYSIFSKRNNYSFSYYFKKLQYFLVSILENILFVEWKKIDKWWYICDCKNSWPHNMGFFLSSHLLNTLLPW